MNEMSRNALQAGKDWNLLPQKAIFQLISPEEAGGGSKEEKEN